MLARLPQPTLRATNLYREIAHSTLFEWWIFVEIRVLLGLECGTLAPTGQLKPYSSIERALLLALLCHIPLDLFEELVCH
jgi:hypothetical protein